MKAIVFAVIGLAAVGCGTRAAEQPAASKLTIDNLIDIKHPSNPSWSPDGKLVLFTWDRAGIPNLYVSDGAAAPVALTNYDTAGVGGAFVAGTPIMPPDADPRAVDYYFSEAKRIGVY